TADVIIDTVKRNARRALGAVGGKGRAIEKLGRMAVARGIFGAVIERPARQQGGVCAAVNRAAGGKAGGETLGQAVADDVTDAAGGEDHFVSRVGGQRLV